MSTDIPRRRLRTYLLWTFLPLATLPLLILAALSHYWVGQVVEKSVERRADTEVLGVFRNLEIVERKLSQELQALSRNPDMVTGVLSRDPKFCAPPLAQFLPLSRFQRVLVYNDQGKKIFEFDQGVPPAKNWEGLFPRTSYSGKRHPASDAFAKGVASPDVVRDRAKFLKTLKQEGSLTYRRKSLSAPLEFVVYQRVLDSDAQFGGYLEGVLPVTRDLVSTLAEHQDVFIGMRSMDSRQQLFSSDLGASRSALLAMSTPTQSVKIDGEDAIVLKKSLGVESEAPLAEVFVGVSKGEANRIQNQILILITLFSVVLVALVVFLTLTLSQKITRPMTQLVQAMESLQEGEWVQPLSADSRSEVGYLVSRFNEMVQSVQVTKRTLELKLEELAGMNQTLHQTQDQLIQSAKLSSLGQLVAGVAHELNNPIAFIYSNMTQMKTVLKSLRDLDQDLNRLTSQWQEKERLSFAKVLEKHEWEILKKDLEDISQSCLEGAIRVKDIVIGLRNFSRLDQGEFREVELSENLRNTVKLLSSQLKNRVEVIWELAPTNLVQCNPSQINQVFVNLIANAAQSIPAKGKIFIRSEWDQGSGFWRLSIRDTGSGIRKELLSRIFDPFFTTKKVGEGTGLGLAIVYGIIEKHGGRIRVNSNTQGSETGTEFVITLPRLQKATPPDRKVSGL